MFSVWFNHETLGLGNQLTASADRVPFEKVKVGAEKADVIKEGRKKNLELILQSRVKLHSVLTLLRTARWLKFPALQKLEIPLYHLIPMCCKPCC